MHKIALAEMSPMLVQTLEKIGKLRNENEYRYYVNECFEQKIRELK